MGLIIIVTVLAAYVAASAYDQPELAALSVLILASVLFVIGHMIISAFEKVALSSLSKSEFISIMSHQLRSPLSAVKWQLNVMLSEDAKQEDKLNDRARAYLEAIYGQNERMIRAVNDLLEVNRIEDRDLILRPTAFSLRALTERVMKNYEKFSSANNVQIGVFAQDDLPMVLADEERIKRVIEHLTDNAVRYSTKKSEIKISIKNYGDRIDWKIIDQGAGIPDTDKPRIFDKFFRSVNASRYQTEGSGVGLFIAKSIIKMHGGVIGFSSELEKGSTFWFSLPIKK